MQSDYSDTQPAPLDPMPQASLPESLHELIDRHAIAYSRYAAACRTAEQIRVNQSSEALTRARSALNNAILAYRKGN
jgi:hypothetical protein